MLFLIGVHTFSCKLNMYIVLSARRTIAVIIGVFKTAASAFIMHNMQDIFSRASQDQDKSGNRSKKKTIEKRLFPSNLPFCSDPNRSSNQKEIQSNSNNN